MKMTTLKELTRESYKMTNEEMLELVSYIIKMTRFAMFDKDPEKGSTHEVLALLFYLQDRLERMIKDDRRK